MDSTMINKIGVNAGLVIPSYILYTVNGTESVFPFIVAGAGLYLFYQNFIDKSLVKKTKPPQVGPEGAFVQPQENWINNDGMPVRDTSAPPVDYSRAVPRFPRQPGGRQ